LVILDAARFRDVRGFFSESITRATLAAQGSPFILSKTTFLVGEGLRNTFGGALLPTFQSPPHYGRPNWVRCGKGSFFDVAFDIRRGSPTYGPMAGSSLSFEMVASYTGPDPISGMAL